MLFEKRMILKNMGKNGFSKMKLFPKKVMKKSYELSLLFEKGFGREKKGLKKCLKRHVH